MSLHWAAEAKALAPPGLHYVVRSSIPGFSSGSVVQWPPDTAQSPAWTGTEWRTGASAMTLAIPANATAGTKYVVSAKTCSSTRCSHARRAVLTVSPSSASWVSESYQSAFPHLATFKAPGQPFATTFQTSDNSNWTASEFSHSVTEIANNASSAKGYTVQTPTGASDQFNMPFVVCGVPPCRQSIISAQSEQVITAGGKVWLTFGGWRWYEGSAPNRSEVVAFDPTTRKFCTYLVPGNNNEVAGIATTGSGAHTWVWFVESRGSGKQPSLDGFEPSAVGSGCSGESNEAYLLPKSVRLLKWTRTGGHWPAQIAVDPASPTLWITDFNGYRVDGTSFSDIERVNIANPTQPRVEASYSIKSANPTSLLGAKPWNVLAPAGSDYVYAIDNGDAEIIRLDKVTGHIDELPIPLTSDVENGFGLALSSGRLYFTLADDTVPTFGAASTFGYVDLSSWQPGSSRANGVIFTGLPAYTGPNTKANYRSIAVGPTGQVVITDQYGIIRLTP